MDKPQKTESEQLNFFTQCHDKFKEASLKIGEEKCFFEIAGKRVCLVFAGTKLVPAMTHALEQQRIPEVPHPDLTICIWDSESTSTEMVAAPCDRYNFTHRGDIKGFNSTRIKTAFHWKEHAVSVMDLDSGTGVFWTQSLKTLSIDSIFAPFRILFHWWIENQGYQLFHAGWAGIDDGSALLFTKNYLAQNPTVVSAIKPEKQNHFHDYLVAVLTPEPYVYELYGNPFLNELDLERFTKSDEWWKVPQTDGVEILLNTKSRESIPSKKPLKAIFILEPNADPDIVIRKISYEKAFRTISFQTMTHFPNTGWHTHLFIKELLQKVPLFSLETDADIRHVHEFISAFLRKPEIFQLKQNITVSHHDKPLISVIIPVYNGEEFIRPALDNVISQQYPWIEIIVVNDGSTDNTEAILMELNLPVRYYYQENKGPASARNCGIREATGEFIVFLDADDLWPENNLNVLVDEMIKNPELDMIHGYAQMMTRHLNDENFEFTGNPVESYPYYISAGIYRKSVFDKTGLFDPGLKFSEDTDWFLRARELNCHLMRIEEVTLYVRRHDHNMTKGKDIKELELLNVLKRKMDRKRVGGE